MIKCEIYQSKRETHQNDIITFLVFLMSLFFTSNNLKHVSVDFAIKDLARKTSINIYTPRNTSNDFMQTLRPFRLIILSCTFYIGEITYALILGSGMFLSFHYVTNRKCSKYRNTDN